MSPTLYRLEGCPFCERVGDRLTELDIDVENVWVAADHSERNEVKAISGQRGVPVLVDDAYGVTMSESDRILEFVEKTYATSN